MDGKLQLEMLKKQNELLKESVRECLALIKELSNIDGPLYEKNLDREFKMRYVKVVSKAKKRLDSE